MRWTLIKKILLGYGIILLLVSAGALYQAQLLNQLRISLQVVNEGYIPLSKLLTQLESLQMDRNFSATRNQNKFPRFRGEAYLRFYTDVIPKLVAERLNRAQLICEKMKQLTSLPEEIRKDFSLLSERINDILNRQKIFKNELKNFEPSKANEKLLAKQADVTLAVQILSKQLDTKIQIALINIEDEQDSTMDFITFMIVGVLVTAILIAVLIAIYTLRPLRKLTEGVRQIGLGNYQTQISVASKDEIGTLAHEFNQMSHALAERELALKQKQEELIQAEQLAAVGNMATHISHEVRNPLNSISLNAELLEDELKSFSKQSKTKEANNLLKAITRELQRLDELTHSYLAMTKGAKGQKINLVNQDLKSLIHEVQELVEPRCKNQSIDFKTKISEDLPSILGDATQIKQAIWNVLLNAIDATPAKGRVELQAKAVGHEVLLSIRDSGPGIREKDKRLMFQPFYTTKSNGSGLGLSITQKIIEDHGGTLSFESSSKQGTIFTLHFPADETQITKEAAQ